jgi:hypothetical protein
MARPRIPKERAEATGAAKRDPGRFAGRSNPRTGRLGKASSWMSAEQAAAWDLFRAEFPWQQESDRGLVEIATVIRARVIARGRRDGGAQPAAALLRNDGRLAGGSIEGDACRRTRSRPDGRLFQLTRSPPTPRPSLRARPPFQKTLNVTV